MKILVTGAGGFIGGHLAKHLRDQGNYVAGLDVKPPDFRAIDSGFCDKFYLCDLRDPIQSWEIAYAEFDYVYHLAANMGGMGWIHGAELDVVRDNLRINEQMARWASTQATRLFFSSSVCVYPDMKEGDSPKGEDDVYPALPDNEYGWEKLMAERLFMNYARHGLIDVRIARFQNCYGELGTWRGGREKAPAAIARKIAMAKNPGVIEVWGDGNQVRNFIHVSDMVKAIDLLMDSDIETPVNIGTEQYVTINELVNITSRIANKQIIRTHIDGPVGVMSRNFKHDKIRSLGWVPQVTLEQGMEMTYKWIYEQVKDWNYE